MMTNELSFSQWPKGRVGIVSIVGRPNVGKSTLMNAVLEFHLCAVSAKPQTTRQNWRGILTDKTSQIIFVDTPGAHQGKTILGEMMLDRVMDGLRDADLILCLVDPTRECGAEDKLVAERVAAAKKPCLLIVNKCDVATEVQRTEAKAFFNAIITADTFEISAIKEDNLDAVLTEIRGRLPQGPFFYEPGEVTDAFMRDIGAEQIREAALELFDKEIPHALAVEIDQWKEGPKKIKIQATIHVEQDSQKRIVVGKNGDKIALIRRRAVISLAELCDTFVNLKLFVKVSKDWRNRKSFLKELGFSGDA
jgi:GTP-binding protein Era